MPNKRLSFIFWNVLPPAIFLPIAFGKFSKFLAAGGHLEVSHLLLGFQLLLISIFFMIRRPAAAVSWKLTDVVTSMLGSWAPFLFAVEKEESFQILGWSLQLAGNLLTLCSIFSLGRSFGILPANRGVQTRGMYRFVRHPIYLSYTVANIGYVLNHPTLYNIAVVFICFLSQVLRIYSEERVLQQDSQYREFQKQVRWRLIPYIF